MGSQRISFLLLLRILAATLLGAGLAGCSGVFYQPTRGLFLDPERLKLEYKTLRFDSSDGTMLNGWFFPARLEKGKPLKGTIVQFHGNGENRSTHFLSLVWAVDAGYNVFTFDYRGYGGSEGSPSQEGVYRDGMAAIRFIKAYVKPLDHPDLILVGQSLGGAVLARCYEDVADRSRILSVVIESSFYSYQAIARKVLSRSAITWILQPLGAAWISDQYSPEESFAKISPTPLLVIHGDRDPLIPSEFGQKIYDLAHDPKTLWKIPRGRHIDTFSLEKGRYRQGILEYWDSLIKKGSQPPAKLAR